MPPEIQIRRCTTLVDFKECVDLQIAVWGPGDIIVPTGLFVVAEHSGGLTVAAYDGSKMVGFATAFAGIGKHSFLHSHMAAVLPEYQNLGIGRRLKLFQREDALKRHIPLIEWTFDPLELKNAHFNLVRLGVIIRGYIPNCYGLTESPLHVGIPTDRFMAEWWVDSERVKTILSGASMSPAKQDSVVRISLPTNIGEIKSRDSEAGIRIQSGIREQSQSWFAKGFAVTSIESHDGVTDYILQHADAIAGLPLAESSGKGNSSK